MDKIILSIMIYIGFIGFMWFSLKFRIWLIDWASKPIKPNTWLWWVRKWDRKRRKKEC